MVSEPTDVVLYTKPGCHLCDVAKTVMHRIAREEGLSFALREVNIETDPEAFEAYKFDIPVIFAGGRELFRHKVVRERFVAALREGATRL